MSLKYKNNQAILKIPDFNFSSAEARLKLATELSVIRPDISFVDHQLTINEFCEKAIKEHNKRTTNKKRP